MLDWGWMGGGDWEVVLAHLYVYTFSISEYVAPFLMVLIFWYLILPIEKLWVW